MDGVLMSRSIICYVSARKWVVLDSTILLDRIMQLMSFSMENFAIGDVINCIIEGRC